MRKYLVSLGLLLAFSGSTSLPNPIGTIGDVLGPEGGRIGTFLSDAVYKLQYPDSASVGGINYTYLGGVSIRTPNRTFQPFSITPPKLSMGCGGIDFTFGAIGYLDPEYLVEFGKAVLENAPAFAFKTAIEVFCPTCEDIMTKIENLANLLNSLQFDACKTAQALVDSVKTKALSGVASKDTEGGRRDFYVRALDEAEKKASEVLSNFVSKNLESSPVVKKIDKMLKPPPGNRNEVWIVEDVMPELDAEFSVGYSELIEDPEFRKLVRALFGDVKIRAADQEEEIQVSYVIDKCLVLKVLGDAGSSVEGSSTGQVVVQLIDTGSTNVCGETYTLRTASGKSIKDWVQDTVDRIVTKIETRQPLNDEELTFLSMYPFPAYRLITTLSVLPGGARAVTDLLAQYMAYELAKLLFVEHVRAYNAVLVDLMQAELFKTSEGAQRSLRLALSAANYGQLREILRALNETQKEIVGNLSENVRMVRAYEKEVAKLLGRDPAYQSVLWSQTIGVRTR